MAKPSVVPGAKKKKTIQSTSVSLPGPASQPSAAAATSRDADDALVQRFTRDLSLVLRHVRDAKRGHHTDADEIGFYGPTAQKLVAIVHKVLHSTVELVTPKKYHLLLEFGDKFYAHHEFRAASRFFYGMIVEASDDEATRRPGAAGSADTASGEDLPATEAENGKLEIQQHQTQTVPIDVLIRAMYGKAMSDFQAQKRRDPVVRHPGTLEKMLAALRLLQRGMEAATALELAGLPLRYSWLVLNGSILIFSIARPLSTLSFAHEVVTSLKWSILCIESVVALSTTKYVLWRMQLYAATFECYELMVFQAAALNDTTREGQCYRAALSCANHAVAVVAQLKKEEELDLPLPKTVVAALSQAQAIARMLVARAKSAAAREPLSKRQLEAALPSASVAEKIRIAVDSIESLARSDSACVGVLSPPSTQRLSDQLSELLDYVVEAVTPMLPRAQAGDAGELSEPLPVVFPLSFHLMLLPHLWRLGKTEQLNSLLGAAKARMLDSSEALSDSDREQCQCELGLFEALTKLKSFALRDNDTPTSDIASVQSSSVLSPLAPLQLLKSGAALPPQRVLRQLAKALTSYLMVGSGELSRTKRDLVLAAALVLWRECAQPLVVKMDASELSKFPQAFLKLASRLLLGVHLALMAADPDDVLLHGHVGMRLATVLRLRGRFRLVAQVLRAVRERIDRKRDELALFDNHFEATTSLNASSEAQHSLALSCATLSCAVDPTLSHSDTVSDSAGPASSRDRVGVFGTGSQFGSVRYDICCLYADLWLLLFQVELDEASAVDALPASSSGHDVRAAPIESLSLVESIEEKLTLECRKNGYMKVLLIIQRMRHRPNQLHENAALAEQALKLLTHVQAHERELVRRLKKVQLRVAVPSNDTVTAVRSVPDANVPLPPVVVSCSSTAITVRILAFQPSLSSLRKRAIAYYMVFAKPSGAGTDVSLTNCALPGTAEPVYPSPRMEAIVSGLIPNESYVFAVAAFDANNDVIQGVGQTTGAVVALHPLPVELCYGYLAQASDELRLQSSATKAATLLYNRVVSQDGASRALWKASPFYRQALKRDVIAKLPLPILNLVVQAILILCHDEVGDGDRDGRLHDPEHGSLFARQVAVLEASKRVAIGVEVASAAANAEAIRALCFKGYRLLLPLLHLHQCNGLTFAPLMTFYQALLTLPRRDWDVDTKSIFARVSFELLRIATASQQLYPAVYPSLVRETLRHHEPQQQPQSNELESLCQIVGIQEALRMNGTEPAATGSQSALPIAAVKAPSGAKGVVPTSSPEPTPRQQSADKAAPLPTFQDLLQQANFSLPTMLSTLETQNARAAPTDIHQLEYVCKLAFVALQRGDDNTASACLAAAKLQGDMSARFRATVAAVGGEHLLPVEMALRKDDDERALEAGTAPSTARSVKTPRQSESAARPKAAAKEGSTAGISSEDVLSSRSPVAGAMGIGDSHEGRDDSFLYLWGAEVFFLQALVLVRCASPLLLQHCVPSRSGLTVLWLVTHESIANWSPVARLDAMSTLRKAQRSTQCSYCFTRRPLIAVTATPTPTWTKGPVRTHHR